VNTATRSYLVWPVVLAIAAFGALVSACGGGADAPAGGATSSSMAAQQREALPTIEVQSLWAWGDAARLETLTSSADVVFRGSVVALKGQRLVLSTPGSGEPGAAAPRWADMPVSQFQVRVESISSGNLPPDATVTLEQLGGVQTQPDGTQVRIMLEGDEPIEVGLTYLFFASFQEDGSMVVPPFGRMKVRADSTLAAEQAWAHLGALQQLSDLHLGDAERRISAVADE
jgi:hypothetical protein